MRSLAALTLLLISGACSVDPAVETEIDEAALRPESEGPPRREPARVILADGSAVISRPGTEPGETELWYQPASPSDSPRVLFPGPGADDRPTLLPDGRILFVSTRTTIASLWVGDIKTGELVQLTNRGLSAGKARTTFTPPPHGELAMRDDGTLEYDAGDGHLVRLMIESAR